MAFDQNALDRLRIDRKPEPEPEGSSRSYKWLIGIVLLLAAAAAAYALIRDNSIEVQTVVAVSTGNHTGGAAVLNASGYVVARRQATVSAKVTGKIELLNIEEGMEVEEGQILARLDETTVRPQYELALRQLDAARKDLEEISVRLAEAERNFNRTAQLRADKLVSEAQLDTAQSEVAALKARLEAARSQVKVAEGNVAVRKQDLDDLIVRAPFAGVIVSKDAQPGEIVSPISAGGGFTRTGIATIVDMDSREIEVDVNEAFINRVKKNQRTEATLDAYPDWVIPSHVINVVPTADRQKATVRVRIAFDELDPRILPQMGVKVTFLEDRDESSQAAARAGVRLPSTAVFKDGTNTYVWRVRNETLERVAVTTGEARDGQIEIVAGVSAGDVLVARPVEGLAKGVRVRTAKR